MEYTFKSSNYKLTMQDFRNDQKPIPIQGVKAATLIISVIIFPIALILAIVHHRQGNANYRLEFLLAFIMGLFAGILLLLGELIGVLILVIGIFTVLRNSTYIRSLD